PKTPARAYENAAARQANCAVILSPKPLNTAGPIITTTPKNPTITPANLLIVIFSSAVKKCAIITVASGVVAFSTAASPEAMWVWPQTIRLKGTTLFRKPMPRKASQTRQLNDRLMPLIRSMMKRIKAAKPTLSVTMVKGVSSATATLTKKNDPPQSMDKVSSMAHPDTSMVLSILDEV